MGKELSVLHGPWSHSRATACSRALFKEKVEKAPPEPRPERFLAIDRREFGSLLHEGGDLSLEQVKKGNGWPNMTELTQELISKEEKVGDDIVHPYAHLAPLAGEIERRMDLYAMSFRVEWGMEPAERDNLIRNNMLGHEMRMAVDAEGNPCNFDECPSDGWRAIIDYAEDCGDGVLLIIDNKNRPAIFSNSELNDDEQLSGYLDMVLKHFPDFDTFRIGIYYFEFGYTQIVDMTREQMEKNVARLRARAAHKESLAEDTIAPEPGFGKCQYCDYIHSCEAGKEAMKGGALTVTDMKQAKQLASWVMVNEEKMKAARKALQIFTKEHGAIVLDDKTEIGYSVNTSSVQYDKDKTLRLLKKAIADGHIKDGKLSDFTSLNLNAVKKAAKIKEVDKALEAAREPKIKPEFDFFRPNAKKGVRIVKEGRKNAVHPEDRDFADDDETPRKARGRVKRNK